MKDSCVFATPGPENQALAGNVWLLMELVCIVIKTITLKL